MLDELTRSDVALEDERVALIMGPCSESKCTVLRKLARCPLRTAATLSEHVAPSLNGSHGSEVTQCKEGGQPFPNSASTLREPKGFPGA